MLRIEEGGKRSIREKQKNIKCHPNKVARVALIINIIKGGPDTKRLGNSLLTYFIISTFYSRETMQRLKTSQPRIWMCGHSPTQFPVASRYYTATLRETSDLFTGYKQSDSLTGLCYLRRAGCDKVHEIRPYERGLLGNAVLCVLESHSCSNSTDTFLSVVFVDMGPFQKQNGNGK